jgi:ACDE family multidrug resistance protein
LFERRPTGLQAFKGDAGRPLAKLNAFEGFSRSILIGVIPLLVLEALGSKEAVTQAYLFASILTLSITLNFAAIERLLKRRWVLTLGVFFTLIAVSIFWLADGLTVAIAIGLQSAAASLFSVCISLYIMDYIGKKELIYTESRRLLYTGMAWMIGPSLGIYLWTEVGDWLAFILTIVSILCMLAYFWFLRLGDNQVIKKAVNRPQGLLTIIPRFFKQSTLRIAYAITLSRAIFWMALFIYGPIYVVEANLPEWIAGGLLSFVSGLLLISPIIRDFASRHGCRNIIIIALILCSLSVAMLYFIGTPKPIGLLFWILASVGGVTVDVLGNIPFMRTVKPRERTEMTMIFSTWREASQLLTPLLVTLILLVAPFEVFYLLLSAILLCSAFAASYLPARL